MKLQVIIDDTLEPDELVLYTKKHDQTVDEIQEVINKHNEHKSLILYKDDFEYVINLDKILFFETDLNQVYAHTINEAYLVNSKLYELESKLPNNFIRISKSTIVNASYILSIQRNITSSSKIQLAGTYKEVFVSRFYYKSLQEKLTKRSL
jgi:DNA-binding LytR/AlgR family response regulator